MSEPIRITRTTSKRDKPKDKDLAFGNVFTDHMLRGRLRERRAGTTRAWSRTRRSLDPATAVLHYGQSLLRASRPSAAATARSGSSARTSTSRAPEPDPERMCIPTLDPTSS